LRRSIDRQSPESSSIPIGLPRWSNRITRKTLLLRFAEASSQIDENSVRRGESDEWMIHDKQVVTIDILLYRSFAKLAQAPPVPLNADSEVLLFIFGSSFDQGSVSPWMVPRKPLQRDGCFCFQRLPPEERSSNILSKRPDVSRRAGCARNTSLPHHAGLALHTPRLCVHDLSAWSLPVFLSR
jgi:hypothetical protein